MKPRLDDADKKFDIGDVVSCQNRHPGEESNPNIEMTVSTKKVETNKQIPGTVSGPNKHG
jgi:hypothetical protein